MATDIDELQIQIQSSAKSANASITALTKRLDKLSSAINGIDAKKLNNLGIGLNNVGRSGSTASSGLNKTSLSTKKAATNFNSLASAFGKFYATYFLFIRGAKSVWKGIESSMDYVETSNYFSVALGQIGQQFEQAGYESAELYTEALTSELSELNRKLTGYTLGSSGEALFSGDVGLGMDIEQLMNFQAKTLSVTNSVGLMGEASIETAKAVSMLAGDISSLTNTDLETVMTNLSSGLIGQSRSLYKYGYDITQNTLQQYALAEGIDKAVSEMTQSEKMQLRLLAILDQSTVAQTDLANTINSVANQYRVFNQQIDNTGRTLGNLFLPIVQNVLTWVNGLIIALNNLFTSLGFKIYGDNWLEELQEGISGGAQEGFEDLEGSVDDATDSLNEFKKGVRGFDELNVLTGGNRVGSGVLEELEGQIDLTDSISKAVANYEKSWDEAFATAENKANKFAETLTIMFEKTRAVDNFAEIVDSIKEFNSAISPFSKGFGSGFLGYVQTLSEVSFEVFSSTLNVLSEKIKDIDEEELELIGESLGTLAGSMLTISTINFTSKVFEKFASGISVLGTTLKKHPILSTFTLASGILSLINLADKKAELKIAIDMSDIDRDLLSIQELSNEIDIALSDIGRELIEIDQQPLANAYQQWKSLNDKVGELTDEEKGLLKLYADKIEELFPKAKDFIDENGASYGVMADELERAVREAVLLAQVQGASELVGEASRIELMAELNLEDAKNSLKEVVEYFSNLFPELTEEEITTMLERYSQAYQSTGHGNLFVGFKNPIDLAEERNEERNKLNFIEHYKLMQEIEEAAIRYSDASLEVIDSELDLEKAREKLALVIEKSTEINKKYAETLNDSEEETLSLQNAVDSLSSKIESTTDFIKGLKDAFDNLGNGGIEKFTEYLTKLEETEIKIPISFTGGSFNGLDFGRNILTPNFSLKAYAGGGMVTSGEVFVARENGMPELVGNFGGRVGVATNDQIIQGIRQAAYEGFLAALSQSGGSGGVTVVLEGDAAGVFRLVRQEENRNYNRTGNSVFVH